MESAGLAVDTLCAVGKYQEAIQTGESALARGLDGAALRRSWGLPTINPVAAGKRSFRPLSIGVMPCNLTLIIYGS